MDIETLGASKTFTRKSLDGMGALQGAPCEIESIADNPDGTHVVTFSWTSKSGTVQKSTLTVNDGEDGKGIKSVAVNENEHLIITYDDNTTSDAGKIEIQSAVTSVKGAVNAEGKKGDVNLEISDIVNVGNNLSYNLQTKTLSVPVDSALSSESESPLQNKVVKDALDNKVDKNGTDSLMTADEHTKLHDISNGAQVNTIESISVNGAEITPDANKNVAISVITNSVNNLINYYLKSETYTKAEVNALISAIVTIDIRAVDTLPTENISRTTIYLVPKAEAQSQNSKDEYINTTGTSAGWEKIGDTEIDLSGYVTSTALNTILADYVTSAALSTALADYVTETTLNTTLSDYVQKETGKGLSTNDFTTAEKEKLSGLENYDDTDIQQDISDIQAVIPSTATAQNKLADSASVPTTLGALNDAWTGTSQELETAQSSIPNGTFIFTNDDGGVFGKINYASGVSNKPQINNITVEGNKSAGDYGLVPAESGKGLSTNDYTNAEKALVGQITVIVRGQAKLNAIANHTYEGEALTDLFASEIQADYDDEWQWLHSRNTLNNYSGINVCDFIPLTTTNNVTLNGQIAGIKTYTGYGDTPVPNCIDIICKELWPTLHPVNKVNYNNGTSAQNHPWLASDLYLYLNSLAGTVPSAAEVGGGEGTAVDYTEGGVYYYLPTQLKNVIIEKRFLLPTRYSASGLLTDDNSWAWKNIGKLWLPDECEVYGVPVWGGKGGYSIGGSGLQYPLFAGNMNRLKFRNGSRGDWWLLSPSSGHSTYWCFVASSGYCGYLASYSIIAAPVCFRVG